MALPWSLFENLKVVQLASPETTNGSKTSDVVCLRTAHKAWIVVEMTQAVGHATLLTPMQATDVAAGTNAVLANVVPIRANEDCGATDTLVPQTAAINYTVTDDIKDKQIIFEIDPATLTAGYDCIYITAATSSQASNYWSVTVYLATRYPQTTPPSAILD